MHPRRCRAAARTLSCGGGSAGRDHNAAGIPSYVFKDHVPQVREKKIEIAPDSATRVHIGHPANTPRLHKIVARTWDPHIATHGSAHRRQVPIAA